MPGLLVLLLFLFSINPVNAANPATNSATVTATVPQFAEPDMPVLISPANNATLSTTAPMFIFNPSWGQTYVDHYQLWLDGNLNTNNISQSTNIIMINALTSLTEGQHTWMIKAIGSNTLNRNSATWGLTIDVTAPLILINQIAGQDVSLSSLDLTTIPASLIISTSQTEPIFNGQSETNAQISLSLTTATNSINSTIATNPDKTFSLKPKNSLIPGNYLVIISATDAAGNTTTLPVWTLKITAPTGITITLPSPLPTIKLPPIPQLFPKNPQALIAFPEMLYCTCYPLIWIIILILILYIFYLHYQIRSKKNKPIS